MLTWFCFAAFPVLLLIGLACFEISAWYRREADYWSNVALMVRLDASRDVHYRPILTWAQQNRPSRLQMVLKPWVDPETRMRVAAAGGGI